MLTYQQQLDALAREHAIHIEFTRYWFDSCAWAATRRVRICRPTTDAEFAVGLHEIAHVVSGPCPGTPPHFAARSRWHAGPSCVACELAATSIALRLAGPRLTHPMHQRLALCLKSYRDVQTWAAQRAELEELAGSRGYYAIVQRRMESAARRELVTQWQKELRTA